MYTTNHLHCAAMEMRANYRLGVSVVTIFVYLGAKSLALEEGELLDMSYKFGESTLYWPGEGNSFTQIIGTRGPTGVLPWYESNTFSAPEHGGTHMDAPAHFSEGKLRIDAIPLSKLVGPAVRVDISEKAKVNRDYQMTTDDLKDWEELNGKIPDDSLLFVYSGWGAYYPDRLAYFGSSRNDTYLDDQGESILHFPGVAPEAAAWLVYNRAISGLGIDTPSIDYGQSTDFMTHQTLFAANIYGLENVANLDKLPNTGARVYALPMKIENGSGAPARIAAMLDEAGTSGAATLSIAYAVFASIVGLALVLM